LDLQLNNITGNIPDSIGHLTNLQHLYIALNKLSGSIPSSLYTIVGIIEIELFNNYLTGVVPTEIGNLNLLAHIDVSSNQLTGPIPTEIGNLISLEIFSLTYNNLTGTIPTEIGLLTNLVSMSFDSNKFSGPIPDEIGKLSKLEIIYLNDNSLSGPIPTQIGRLKSCNMFFVRDNIFSGAIPTEIGRMSSLTSLIAGYNRLSGWIPTNIGKLTKLTNIYLNQNQLTGPFPTEFGYLDKLAILALDENRLNGSIPTEIGLMTDIESIDLSNNDFSGHIPTGIGMLEKCQLFSFGDNHLSGMIPTEIGLLTSMTGLYLNKNYLSGTIPTEIGKLRLLNYLALNENSLNAEISTEIGGLTLVQNIYLDDNDLIGEIPTEIGFLKDITNLRSSRNELTGKIPTQIGYLTLLEEVTFEGNHLTGEIPTEIGLMTAIKYLYLSENQLTGIIPTEIGLLIRFESLYVETNQLTGKIPTELGSLSYLNSLDVHSNQLSGKLPDTLFSLTQLNLLFLGVNHFTGCLSTEIGQLKLLQQLEIVNNNITGPIPTEIGQLTNLIILFLNNNEFTNEIPSELVKLTQLEQLYLSFNELSGSIPTEIGLMTTLVFMKFESNKLSGEIPTQLCQLTNMKNFTLFSNELTRSFPDCFRYLIKLRELDISDNRLTGSVPPILQNITSLEYLNISYNAFKSGIDDFFNTQSSSQVTSRLSIVDVSNNRFTGTLPIGLFKNYANIQIISAGINCFNGQLPDSICSLQILEILILDAVGGAPSCIKKIIPGLSAYELQNKIDGSIPLCLFNMSSLQTLHLSGNLISDTLSVLQNSISSSLQYLDLSHNLLTGTIPSPMCNHEWRSLDLGFNRLTGVLCPSIIINESLSLEVNRLSGSIPSVYKSIPSISILTSNIFECYDSSSLPSQDTASSNYSCGSDATNNSIYLFLGIMGLCLIFRFVMTYLKHGTLIQHFNFHFVDILTDAAIGPKLSKLQLDSAYRFSMKQQNRSMLWFLIPTIFGIFLSIILHQFYSTHSFSYAWTISFGYLSGEVPAGIIGLYVTIFQFAICYFSYHKTSKLGLQSFKKSEKSSISFSLSTSDMIERFPIRHTICIIVIFAANAVATVTVNIYFIFHRSNITGAKLELLQVALSLFKFMWSNVIVGRLVSLGRKIFQLGNTPKTDALFMTVLNLFSVMIAPCVATVIASKDCFYYLFFSEPEVSAQYSYAACDLINSNTSGDSCLGTETTDVTASYQPTYTYSYQCSTALLTDYASVFVYYFITSAFLVPVVRWLFQSIQMNLRDSSNDSAVISDNSDVMKQFIMKAKKSILWFIGFFVLDLDVSKSFRSQLRKEYNSSRKSSNVITMICVLVSFGCAFPPLGIVAIVSLLVHEIFRQVELARLLLFCDTESLQLDLSKAIDDNFSTYDESIEFSINMLVLISCGFMSLFIFDTLGDTEGALAATGPMVAVAVAMPIVVIIIREIIQRCIVSNSILKFECNHESNQ
jgi:Leucine-rich repeat (LRR) protein